MYASKFLLALVSSASLFGGVLAISGDATWYEPGLGSCGINNTRDQLVAAINPGDFAGKAACLRNARVTYQGKSVTVQIVDLCPGCGPGGIDLSPAAFQQLGDLGLGRIHVDWNFV